MTPQALWNDRFGPVPSSNGRDQPRLCDKLIPGLAAGIDDSFVGGVNLIAEVVLAQVLPNVFSRVEFRRIRRQVQQAEVIGNKPIATGPVPAGTVENKHGMRTGTNLQADLLQMQLHRPGIGLGQHQCGAMIALGAHGTEDIGPLVALIPWHARTGTAFCPNVGQRALLADARFILT
jgi:hypothetical protein